eukprot:TRINITY_DN66499_c0_g1_i1.p1 TRINITY_DN66499_c0_g1~~TRINITY_DN66499_c0_g1_i1.p1  ORF type:complete len:257 (-),score=34.90 TRINITY_DN66499_c0_g1_i1:19-726(-)
MPDQELLIGVGCFWYSQHLLEPRPGEPAFPGIESTEVGYYGGTPEEVEACGCSMKEVVRIKYSGDTPSGNALELPLADPLGQRLQEIWQRDASEASTFRQLVRLFWMCQNHNRSDNRFVSGYKVQLVVFSEYDRVEAERSRQAFAEDLRCHLESKEAVSLEHVEIINGSVSDYMAAEDRHQHWFHKGAGPALDGQSKLSKKGLGVGLGGMVMLTPNLDSWLRQQKHVSCSSMLES